MGWMSASASMSSNSRPRVTVPVGIWWDQLTPGRLLVVPTRLVRVPGQELLGVDHCPEVADAVALDTECEDHHRFVANVAGEPWTAVDRGLDDLQAELSSFACQLGE